MINVIVFIAIILSFRFGRRVSKEEIDILHDTAIRQAGQIEQRDSEIMRLLKEAGGTGDRVGQNGSSQP